MKDSIWDWGIPVGPISGGSSDRSIRLPWIIGFSPLSFFTGNSQSTHRQESSLPSPPMSLHRYLFVAASLLPGFVLCAQTSPPASTAPAAGSSASSRPANQATAQGARDQTLAEAFRGITANGSAQPGLYSLRSTGVSTDPVRQAAGSFIATLTPEQKSKTLFPVDDSEWQKWTNVHRAARQGVSFKEMSEPQREAAFALLRASLSAKGLQLSRDIMRLNETLGELNQNNFAAFGEWLYWITIMGEPSATEPWGWQIDGHHLVINYFVLGDQVVMSPTFVGSEPVTATAGKHKGTTILQEEQDRGAELLRSLEPTQRQRAVLQAEKTGNNNLTEAYKDNVQLDYAGIPAAALNSAQQQTLLKLIQLFVDNLDDGHAKIKMEEVRAHLPETHFAWIGGTDENDVFYYRIHSPVILIEFDHQRPANLRHLSKSPTTPTRDHIHVVIRTPNGNDYGKDLLRQHLEQHPH